MYGTTWVQAANLHAPNIATNEEGNIFNTITNGVRNMPPYGNQVPVEDRWAIVAYVRALEFSQNAPRSVLSEAELKELNSRPSTEPASTEPAAIPPSTEPAGSQPAKAQ